MNVDIKPNLVICRETRSVFLNYHVATISVVMFPCALISLFLNCFRPQILGFRENKQLRSFKHPEKINSGITYLHAVFR